MADVVRQSGLPLKIGGWLALPALGTLLAPIALAYAALQDSQVLLSDASPGWALKFCSVDLAINLPLFAGWIWAATLMIGHRRLFPRVFMVLVVIGAAITVPQFIFFGRHLPGPNMMTLPMVKSILAAIIWVPYMALSKRVAATFIK